MTSNEDPAVALHAQIVALQAENEQLRTQVAALKQEQSLLKAFLDNIPTVCYVLDEQERFLFVNRQYLTATGQALMDVVGKRSDVLFPPDTLQEWVPYTQQMRRTKEPVEREHVEVYPDGNHILSTLLFPILNEEGNIIAVGGMTSDVSERKQSEARLRMGEELLQMVLEVTKDGVWDWNIPTGEIKFNTRWLEMLDYAPDEYEGHMRTWSRLLHPDDGAAVDAALQEHWSGRRPIYEVAIRLLAKGGDWKWILSRGRVVERDGEGNPTRMVGTHVDITERRRIEEERAALQEQMIEAQQAAIRELSTPLLPLAPNVIALPLVGTIDSSRTQQIMETLLEGIVAAQATIAIVDITGVRVVDTQVAQTLIQAAQAVKLVGAQVVLTGIQPQIAQTLVQLGTDLSRMVTLSTLQAGIAYALRNNGAIMRA